MDTSNECTWPEVKQRAHYLAWLAATLGTAVLLGLTVDLIVVAATGGDVGFGLIELVYICAVATPLVYQWRRYGEAYCQFLELEHALEGSVFAPAEESVRAFAKITDFVDRIEAARGMERQVIRNEAKAWLLAHGSKLSHEEREYVAVYLGYLHRP